MKIAISTDNGFVSEHFGRCPEFTIIDIEDKKVIRKETIVNPGHKTGYLPQFFKDKGVDCVIAGGAGFRAQGYFQEFGIRLITGVQGKVEDVIQHFIEGKIEQGKDLCNPGKGKGYGVEKEDAHHNE